MWLTFHYLSNVKSQTKDNIFNMRNYILNISGVTVVQVHTYKTV